MGSFRVIAGLGNPGPTYARTRHNAGFLALDALAEKCAGASFSWKEKHGALVGEVRLADASCLLIKPQNFMNRSGGPIRALMDFYKWNVGELLVLHDEIDIAFGELRVKQGGGDGGHNGVKSIADAFGSPEFARVRIGVGRPTNPEMEVASWVLENFSADEGRHLGQLLSRAAEAAEVLCAEGLRAAQNRFN